MLQFYIKLYTYQEFKWYNCTRITKNTNEIKEVEGKGDYE